MSRSVSRHPFEKREFQNSEIRNARHFARLGPHIAAVIRDMPGWARQLEGVEPAGIDCAAALRTLPILRRSALRRAQQSEPPFGGFCAGAPSDASRLFMLEGRLRVPQSDANAAAAIRALRATGFRPGEIILNAASYHGGPHGAMFDRAAQSLGCAVFPAGDMPLGDQLSAVSTYHISGAVGSVRTLDRILSAACAPDPETTPLTRVLACASGRDAELRPEKHSKIDIRTCYLDDLTGIIAYETVSGAAKVVTEDVIVEILRPGSTEPVGAGQFGEVIITNFDRNFPLIRYATGKLSSFVEGCSQCGRTNIRLQGWRVAAL